MARSHSIHILSHPDTKEILAAFTVKYEMETWRTNYEFIIGKHLVLLSVRDGKGRYET